MSSDAQAPEAVDVDALAAAVTKQGAVVKQLKKDGAGAEALEPEVAKLVQLRAELEAARKAQDGNKEESSFSRPGGSLLVGVGG